MAGAGAGVAGAIVLERHDAFAIRVPRDVSSREGAVPYQQGAGRKAITHTNQVVFGVQMGVGRDPDAVPTTHILVRTGKPFARAVPLADASFFLAQALLQEPAFQLVTVANLATRLCLGTELTEAALKCSRGALLSGADTAAASEWAMANLGSETAEVAARAAAVLRCVHRNFGTLLPSHDGAGLVRIMGASSPVYRHKVGVDEAGSMLLSALTEEAKRAALDGDVELKEASAKPGGLEALQKERTCRYFDSIAHALGVIVTEVAAFAGMTFADALAALWKSSNEEKAAATAASAAAAAARLAAGFAAAKQGALEATRKAEEAASEAEECAESAAAEVSLAERIAAEHGRAAEHDALVFEPSASLSALLRQLEHWDYLAYAAGADSTRLAKALAATRVEQSYACSRGESSPARELAVSKAVAAAESHLAAHALRKLVATRSSAALLADALDGDAIVSAARTAASEAQRICAALVEARAAREAASGEDAAAAASRVTALSCDYVQACMRAAATATAAAAVERCSPPALWVDACGRKSPSGIPGTAQYINGKLAQDRDNGDEVIDTVQRDGNAAALAALAAYLAAVNNPTASQLAAAFPPGAGHALVVRWLWASQMAGTDSFSTRIFVNEVTLAPINGWQLVTEILNRNPATMSYVTHASICRMLCDDLSDLFKTGIRFVCRDLRQAAAGGGLARHAGVAAVVGAVPAAVLVNGHWMNGANALARAHLVLLFVATCATIRHIIALAMTIHQAVA